MQTLRRIRCFLLIGVPSVLGMARLVYGQDIDFTLGDIKGVPSTIAMANGKKQADRAQAQERERHAEREHKVAMTRQQHRRQLLLAPEQTRSIVRIAFIAPSHTSHLPTTRHVHGGSRKPLHKSVPMGLASNHGSHKGTHALPATPPAVTVIETPLQNLTLAITNPKGLPVAGLHLVATVHTKSQAERVIENLATDAVGQVRLEKIGPLPVSVDLAVTAEQQGEWEFADPVAACLLIPNARGARIAAYRTTTPFGLTSRLETRTTMACQQAGAVPLVNARQRRVEYKTVVYEDRQQMPLVAERNVVDLDVLAPAGSKVTTAALPNEELVVPGTGHLVTRLSASMVGAGRVPIRVAARLPAGDAEAVISDYPCDPYAHNEAHCPQLQLVRVDQIALATDLDVMDGRVRVVQALGVPDTGRKRGHESAVTVSEDGSEWWDFSRQGLRLKLRRSPFTEGRNADWNVERIRITAAEGGSVGGITAGSDCNAVTAAFGEPQVRNDPLASDHSHPEPGVVVDSYLDRGLRLGCADGKVRWIEIARPRLLLASGTTAFVPRPPARLFVEGFTGSDEVGLRTVQDLKAYLGHLHAIRLVDRRDEADLVLSARVTDFQERRGQVIGAIPFSYECSTRLVYSLFNPAGNHFLIENKVVSARARADYGAEAAAGAFVIGLLAAQHSDTARIVAGLGGVLGVSELQRCIRRAANRCPGLCARTVFGDMVSDISRAADFAVRVTDIDYLQGTLRLGVGKAEGIQVSEEVPFEFELLVRGRPLPGRESGLVADVYTATVVEVQEHTCLCQFRHLSRAVNRASEHIEAKIGLKMLRTIPDPATGVVSARAWMPLPQMAQEVVPEVVPGVRTPFEQLVLGTDTRSEWYRRYDQAVQQAAAARSVAQPHGNHWAGEPHNVSPPGTPEGTTAGTPIINHSSGTVEPSRPARPMGHMPRHDGPPSKRETTPPHVPAPSTNPPKKQGSGH